MIVAWLLACASSPDSGGVVVDPGDTSGDTADPGDSADTGDSGAVEACNGVDDDGDGAIDEAGALGCTDRWADADGDGLGGGDPRCECGSDGVSAGGDCDDGDDDRGADCAEGELVPVAGARLLHDDPTDYYNLTDAGRFGVDGEVGLLLWAPGASVVVADVPTLGDVPLSTVRHATLDYPSQLARPLVGDLDGDSLADLGSLAGALVAGDGGGCSYAPELTLRAGPLVEDRGFAWSTPLTALELPTCDPTLSGFVADLDGAPGPELWVQVGTEAEVAGPGFVARLDAAGAVTPLEAWTDTPGRLALAPGGDRDGDGVDDLLRLDGDAAGTTLVVFLGPVAALPPLDAASVVLTAPVGARPTALPDLDGDGAEDLALTDGETVWLLDGRTDGAAADVAWATVGAEHDGEGNLVPTAADLGAGPALVVADTFWPARSGAGNLRGAVYVFATPPLGHVDARSADVRVVGEDFGAFGAFPSPLPDGRIAAGANLLGTDVGTGVTWVFAAE